MSVIKLSDCCRSISDGDHMPPPKSAEGIPFLTISNIDSNNHLTFENTMFVPKDYWDQVDEKRKAQPGDVLLSVTGSYGIPVYVDFDREFVFQRHIAILKPDNNVILGKYLYYLLKNPSTKKTIDKLVTGAIQKTLGLDTIRNMSFDIPSIEEQQHALSILSQIDDLIDNNNAICSNLEEMAKLIYDYWFVQFDFPDENGKPYKSSGGKMVWNDDLKREIPEGWEVKLLGDIAEMYQPKTFDAKLLETEGKYRVYGAGGYMGQYHEYNHEDSEVFISCRGSCGNIYKSMPQSLITGNAMIVHACDEHYKEYLYWSLLRFGVKNCITGSVQPQITRDELSKWKIVMPRILNLTEFNIITSQLSEMVINFTEENQQLASLRDFLLPMLMNGQVKVKEA